MRRLRLFAGNSQAVVATEMALMLPMLIILLFGGLEGGYYLWSEHKVIKAVRDGSRFAGRQTFDKFDCGAGNVSDAATETKIINLTRTGTLDGSGAPKIPGWTAPATVAVTVTCDSTHNTGLYAEVPGGAPIVRVSATVPYRSLFFNLGFATSGLGLKGSSQAAVMGI